MKHTKSMTNVSTGQVKEFPLSKRELLIEAAPELLEALEVCLEALEQYQPNCIENYLAKRAIAKAKGRE